MKMIKKLLLLGLAVLPLALSAQTAHNERVGVQTKTPTEQLDGKGTVRVEKLPKKGGAITTGPKGT